MKVDETTGLHLYTTGKFYQIIGGDYIKYAFEYANKATGCQLVVQAYAQLIDTDLNAAVSECFHCLFLDSKTDSRQPYFSSLPYHF